MIKKIGAILLTTSVLLGLTACGGDGRYHDKENNFSIDIPEGWTATEGTEGTAMMASSPRDSEEDLFNENFNVTIEELPYEVSLEEYANTGNEMLEQALGAGFSRHDTGTETLNGVDAAWISYGFSVENLTLEVIAYMLVKGTTAYELTFGAATESIETYRPIFQETAHSFVIE